MWRKIKKIINQNDSFLITTHVNPDGDGIGSACALIELLRMMGKNVSFVCDSPIPPRFQFLDFHHLFRSYSPEQDCSAIQVVIIVDASIEKRIGRVSSLLSNSEIIAVYIDHHQPPEEIPLYAAIDPHASSTGSMIYTLFKEYGLELNNKAAIGLYASIISDTGRFSYASTDRKAHKIAEECIKKGVDPDKMHMQIFRQITIPEFKMLARALNNMELQCNDRVIIQQLSKRDYEEGGKEEIDRFQSGLEYIHEFNKLVAGIECAILLCELPNGKVRISMRSHTERPVDQIMRTLGGGGHHKAAGATVPGPINEVKQRVLQLLGSDFSKSE